MTKLDNAPRAWALNGIIQYTTVPSHELTPEQAREFARSLMRAADCAETHIRILAQQVANTKSLEENHRAVHTGIFGRD